MRCVFRNKAEISGHSRLAATEYALPGAARDSRCRLWGMVVMVAAVWDQPSGLEIIAQK
jgi:hypothetical protein